MSFIDCLTSLFVCCVTGKHGLTTVAKTVLKICRHEVCVLACGATQSAVLPQQVV